MLIRERYKVIRVLYAERDYAALQAVDIQSREKESYLLNVYEGEYLKPYLNHFVSLRGCDAYRDMFLWDGSLVVVFTYREGIGIDQVFYCGVKLDWRLRMGVARALFHQALAMSGFPPQISCAAFLSENIQILQEEPGLTVNYAVRPLEEMNDRELVFLLTDQIQKILLPRWDAPREERRFLRTLCSGNFPTVVAVYGKWSSEQPKIQEEYERIEKKNVLARNLYLFFMNLQDWFETHIRKRKGEMGP